MKSAKQKSLMELIKNLHNALPNFINPENGDMHRMFLMEICVLVSMSVSFILTFNIL